MADFFSEDLLGGAESNDSVLIQHLESQDYDLEKLHCREVTVESLQSYGNDVRLIVSNFVSLREDAKRYIQENLQYVIYEHDHKYVATRDPSRFPSFKIPDDKIINRSFYENAIAVVVLSEICRKILVDNLSLENVRNIGTSLWSAEKLDKIGQLLNKEKTIDYGVLDSQNSIKGTKQALEWCRKRGVKAEPISSPKEEEFLELLSQCRKFVFIPQVLETFNRLTAEAKMLNCKIITNKTLLGFASESTYNLSGESLLEETRKRIRDALGLFEALLSEKAKKKEVSRGKNKMNIVSYNKFLRETDKMCHKIASSDLQIDAVVPALRSGMIPAFKIAERLNLPIMVDEKIHAGLRINKNREIKNLLLVDDSINTGTNLRNEIKKYAGKYNVYVATVICSPGQVKNVDFYSIVVDSPRIFEWNMFHCSNTSKVMFDMDGVICIDPRVYDDDGKSYENEIADIPSLFVPKYPIHSIVTNRIERWRGVTDSWLKRHGVQYGELIMQQYPTAVERRRGKDPGTYKAEHYINSDACLFIESNLAQAQKIYKISKKPVYCIETNSFLGVDE